jgi:hypothetical protein
MLVLIFNIIFLIRWFILFLEVLVRIHFSLITWVWEKICCKKLPEIDDYETNLSKWRTREQEKIKAKYSDQMENDD